MAKFVAVVLGLFVVIGGAFLYRKSSADQEQLNQRLDRLNNWAEGVSDWRKKTDTRLVQQLEFQHETREWMKQNQESINRQLNDLQTVVDGQLAKANADAKTTPDDQKQSIAKVIKEEGEARKKPIEDRFDDLKGQLPGESDPEFERQKENLDQQRNTYNDIKNMADNPAESFADGKQAAQKAGKLNGEIKKQKDRVEGEINELKSRRAELLQEQQKILQKDPMTEDDKKRLEEIRKEIEEIDQKLEKKEKESDLLKMLGCLLKAVTYLGSFYADYQAPGSGQALRELASEIPCELGVGGKGSGENNGDGPGGGNPPMPPTPPPGVPPTAPTSPTPTPPEPTPPEPTPPEPTPGNVDGTTKDGAFEMNLSGTVFQFRKKGESDWQDYLTLNTRSAELLKNGKVLSFDSTARNKDRKYVLMEDAEKNQFILFENQDPEPYSTGFGGAGQE